MTVSSTRRVTVVAQDPGVRANGRIVTTEVDVPLEALAPGPRGSRVHVVDFDAATGDLYAPFDYTEAAQANGGVNPFKQPSNTTILTDPRFHAVNVYALVMRTLARFEFALGRRVGWGFFGGGHQLRVVPHAFAEANAFYAPNAEALMFGYFRGAAGNSVFSCLAHDVVVHETTHALVDGLRRRYTDPSSPDQAAFHEGFADVVALLSVFSLGKVVRVLLDRADPTTRSDPDTAHLIHVDQLAKRALQQSILTGLAEEMGTEMSGMRGAALRQSAELPPLSKRQPSDRYLASPEFQEPHRRGEILVAAVMNAFLDVWVTRISHLKRVDQEFMERSRVAEEGSEVADYLLTMVIRALDYTPPVHLEFGDVVSAILTADHEIRPNDSKYNFRRHLKDSFASYGIQSSAGRGSPDGLWVHFNEEGGDLAYQHTRFESMQRDPDEVFRFIWNNREALRLHPGGYTRVISIRPVTRIAPDDGFPLRETVVECLQELVLRAADLGSVGVDKPAGMDDDQEVTLQGGMTLVFDEYGRVKFRISNSLPRKETPSPGALTSPQRHSNRLQYLYDYGHFRKGASLIRQFSAMHQMRTLDMRSYSEGW